MKLKLKKIRNLKAMNHLKTVIYVVGFLEVSRTIKFCKYTNVYIIFLKLKLELHEES